MCHCFSLFVSAYEPTGSYELMLYCQLNLLVVGYWKMSAELAGFMSLLVLYELTGPNCVASISVFFIVSLLNDCVLECQYLQNLVKGEGRRNPSEPQL